MSYIKAENVLPQELIETIQQYVDGKLIYIPCREIFIIGEKHSEDSQGSEADRKRKCFIRLNV